MHDVGRNREVAAGRYMGASQLMLLRRGPSDVPCRRVKAQRLQRNQTGHLKYGRVGGRRRTSGTDVADLTANCLLHIRMASELPQRPCHRGGSAVVRVQKRPQEDGAWCRDSRRTGDAVEGFVLSAKRVEVVLMQWSH